MATIEQVFEKFAQKETGETIHVYAEVEFCTIQIAKLVFVGINVSDAFQVFNSFLDSNYSIFTSKDLATSYPDFYARMIKDYERKKQEKLVKQAKKSIFSFIIK